MEKVLTQLIQNPEGRKSESPKPRGNLPFSILFVSYYDDAFYRLHALSTPHDAA
jgi:hypothetical protein